MYLDMGKEAVRTGDLVGIFDMDATTVCVRTREYLNRAEKQGVIRLVTDDLPVSFVVSTQTVYLTAFTSGTLAGRCQQRREHFGTE